jgi:hypothetical protein
LLHRSHKLRLSHGDQFGKPGEKFPARPKLQGKTTYRRIIAALRTIEQQYMHIITNDRRYLDRERNRSTHRGADASGSMQKEAKPHCSKPDCSGERDARWLADSAVLYLCQKK